MSNYDNWKTTPPDYYAPDPPPCDETPKYDDYDVCMWCGAGPMQGCEWSKP